MSNWFTETRIAWIKESVEIFDFVNRVHIQKKFGISTPQASYDLAEAMRRWPCLMAYDKSEKRYVAEDKSTLVASPDLTGERK